MSRGLMRQVVEELLRDVPDAFDHDRTCPWCVSRVDDPRKARLLRLDMKKLGFRGAEESDAVVLLCPRCGFEEEG